MTKKTKQEAGRLGALATHKVRYETITGLSKYVAKVDLNWMQAKWDTKQLVTLLKAYQNGN